MTQDKVSSAARSSGAVDASIRRGGIGTTRYEAEVLVCRRTNSGTCSTPPPPSSSSLSSSDMTSGDLADVDGPTSTTAEDDDGDDEIAAGPSISGTDESQNQIPRNQKKEEEILENLNSDPNLVLEFDRRTTRRVQR